MIIEKEFTDYEKIILICKNEKVPHFTIANSNSQEMTLRTKNAFYKFNKDGKLCHIILKELKQ